MSLCKKSPTWLLTVVTAAAHGLLACTQIGNPQGVNTRRDKAAALDIRTVYAPECPGAPSLDGELNDFDDLELGSSVEPTTFSVRGAIRRAHGPWFLFLFSGHGTTKDGQSSICVKDGEITVANLIRDFTTSTENSKSVGGGVFVLNACESAAVDPSQSKIPLSIISASPFDIRTDSLFGSSLGAAIQVAAEDWNCDGLVTDQELFDALVVVLERSRPQSLRPALPKLRRQATSEIPLPIRPRLRPECIGVRDRIATLVERYHAEWKTLASALRAQINLSNADAPHGGLPHEDSDYYFVVRKGNSASTQNDIDQAAAQAGLAKLPTSAEQYAHVIAPFSIFAEIYKLEVDCGYVRVFRMSDGLLVGTDTLSNVANLLPQRATLSVPRRLFSGARPRQRVLGLAPSGGLPVPCYEQVGQCFAQVSTSTVTTEVK